MFAQPRWSVWALPTLLAGVFWITAAHSLPPLARLLPFVFGAGLLAAGVVLLLAPGDRRVTELGAISGVVGALLAVPYALVTGPALAFALVVTGLAGAWGAGRMALQLEPHTPGVPAPGTSPRLAAKVATDETILGFELLSGGASVPLDGSLERVVDEIDRAHARFEREGFLEKPETYHVAPPDLIDPEIRKTNVRGFDVEVLRFESGYAPAEDEPGRERWLGYDACRDAYAYVLRHEGPPRPWLIATNGYRMGHPGIDVPLFGRFHPDAGRPGGSWRTGLRFNVLIPVLPLHGRRKTSWHSGEGFLGFDVLDTIHAETQAIWDMRRLLSWIRAQEAPAVSAFGLSLGGLTTANFASLATGLACAVPGIPLVHVRGMIERHGPPHQLAWAATRGFDLDRIGDLLRVVDPTFLTPQVPLEARLLFGGTADRLVTPNHVQDLWRHWEEPEIVWYEGSHISFMGEAAVWQAVDRMLGSCGRPA